MAVSVSEYKKMLASGGSAGKQNAKPSKRKKNPEYDIQAEYVAKMADKYPLVMVFSDTAAHIGKSMFQQIRANKLQSKISKDWPDVFVAQPSGIFAGLFLEFKAKSPYLKDGVTLSSDKHIQAQAATMQRLRERGYFCAFAWTVGGAMVITEIYLTAA
jgi:threonine synthase